MKKILNRLLILSLAVIIGISGINAKNIELDVKSKTYKIYINHLVLF